MYQFTIVLMVFGLVFTVLMLLSPKRKLIFAMLSLIIWFTLAALVVHVAIPYQVENSLSGTVIEGVQYTDSAAPFSWLFYGLGMFSFVWVAICIVEKLTGRKLLDEEEEQRE